MEWYLSAALAIYVPVAAGALYALAAGPGRRGSGELSEVVAKAFLPLLLFTSTYAARDRGAGFAQMGAAALISVAVSLASSYLISGDRELVFLSAYVNAGYIPIPLAQALWGPEALQLVSFYVLFNNSVGNVLAPLLLAGNPREGLRRLARFPPLYAVALGLLFPSLGVDLPPPLIRALSATGGAAPYLALFDLGAQAVRARGVRPADAARVGVVRFVVSPAAAWALAPLYLERGSLACKVALLESLMPPAVTGATLCAVYGREPERGAGVVLLLTALFLLLLPVVLPLIA